MSEPKWTKGPWVTEVEAEPEDDDPAVYVCHAGTVCDVSTVCNLLPSKARSAGQCRADAHLIAAAPDMAEALKAAIAISDRNVGDGGRTDECQQVYDQCAAALAKARGEA